jgi:hypothetical protein
MGWVESAPYFCAASEIAQDVAVKYIETKIGSLLAHKFEKWAGASEAMVNSMGDLRYVLEVYVNNFISCIVPTSRQQIEHVTRGILHRIHTTFSHPARMTARIQPWQRSSAKATALMKATNAFWASTLTVSTRQSGWKRISRLSYSQYFTNGSEGQPGQKGEYHLHSLSRSRQSSDMLSLHYRKGAAC